MTQAVLQGIRRQRAPLPRDSNSRLPQILKQTDRGEQLIVFEDDSKIIFTCRLNLTVLKEYKHLFVDDTFSVRKFVLRPSDLLFQVCLRIFSNFSH